MSYVRPLLSLSDDELEDVMAATHLWRRELDIGLDSDLGQNAIRVTTEFRKTKSRTAVQLLKQMSQKLPSDL